jgi:hypothetical protein
MTERQVWNVIRRYLGSLRSNRDLRAAQLTLEDLCRDGASSWHWRVASGEVVDGEIVRRAAADLLAWVQSEQAAEKEAHARKLERRAALHAKVVAFENGQRVEWR